MTQSRQENLKSFVFEDVQNYLLQLLESEEIRSIVYPIQCRVETIPFFVATMYVR